MATDTVHDGTAAVEDERLAASCSANVLISVTTRAAAEGIAQRIHQTSRRAGAPFVTVNAGVLSTDGNLLRAEWDRLFAAAGGGTVFVTDLETMPRTVQEQFMAVLDELASVHLRNPFRLMAGTTVPLFDRVSAGTFSEQLFYRLNVLHLDGSDC